MEYVEVTLSMCTLFKGVPHGLAIICYSHQDDSFKGVGVFDHGQLHNAPFICVDGYGYGKSFSNMKHGRPAGKSYCT